jgi:hypothetical protein
MLRPRRAYARLGDPSSSYILVYVLFFSVLIAVASSITSVNRVTVPLTLVLAAGWLFVPLVHVLIGAAMVASAPAGRARGNRALALLLMGHAPWSLWLIVSAALVAWGGYPAYRFSLLLAFVPLVLTWRILYVFCRDVLGVSHRGACSRVAVHQAVVWSLGVFYVEKAVGLVPRISGWLQ